MRTLECWYSCNSGMQTKNRNHRTYQIGIRVFQIYNFVRFLASIYFLCRNIQAWVFKVKKIPETAEKSCHSQKFSQNGMKNKKFLEFQDQNFLKPGISWRNLMSMDNRFCLKGFNIQTQIFKSKSSSVHQRARRNK